MNIKFKKLHGLGNDYHFIDCINQKFPENFDFPALSRAMSERHFGVGSDGIVLIKESGVYDFKMQIFNADGSEAEMCGNGIRSFAKYVHDHSLSDKKILKIETGAGLIQTEIVEEKDGKASLVRVDMGEPVLSPEKIPVTGNKNKDQVVGELYCFEGHDFGITCVSMGNPHCVIFVDEITDEHVLTLGPLIHADPVFPQKINVEFVEVLDSDTIKMRVWERGSGETLACGTGACASVVAGVLNNHIGRNVEVILPGGSLKIEWSEKDNRIYKTGPSVEVFAGEFPWTV